MDFIILILFALLMYAILKKKPWDMTKSSTHIPSSSPYIYSRKLYIMTRSEAFCFRKLEEASSQHYYVFPQVHLSSLLNHAVKGQNWKGALSKIQRKSVDFVLVDKSSLQTAFAIELDDTSHLKPDRQERDTFVNEVIRAAGIPLVRLRHNEISDIPKLIEKLEQARAEMEA